MQTVPEKTKLLLQFSSLRSQVVVFELQLLELFDTLVEAGPEMPERVMYLVTLLEVSDEIINTLPCVVLVELDGLQEVVLAKLVAFVAPH